jgi:F-type H+-transporting ATPase subunit alpha
LIEFEKNGLKAIVLNLEEDNVGAVCSSEAHDLTEGDIVKRTRKIASIEVGEGLLGRVINTLGEPIDGKERLLAKGLRCHWKGKLLV